LGVSRVDFSPKEKFLVTASVKATGKGEEVKEDDPKVAKKKKKKKVVVFYFFFS
jgi:hypothetical protein